MGGVVGMGGITGPVIAQALQITGTGFRPGPIFYFRGAGISPNWIEPPSAIAFNDTQAAAVVSVPEPEPGTPSDPSAQVWVFIPDTDAGDGSYVSSAPFSFQVGKSS